MNEYCLACRGWGNRFKCTVAVRIGEKDVLIDRCIAVEIASLNRDGVSTTMCCCGHTARLPWVLVPGEYKQRMLDMHFIFIRDSFNPRTSLQDAVFVLNTRISDENEKECVSL